MLCSQGAEVNHNQSAGVYLNDRSLVLRHVTRASAGPYSCLAANSQGKSSSNEEVLSVQCEYAYHGSLRPRAAVTILCSLAQRVYFLQPVSSFLRLQKFAVSFFFPIYR